MKEYQHKTIIGGNSVDFQKNKVVRSSNLELYRISCMLMILAHHYVMSSGFTGVNSPIANNPSSLNTLFLILFGVWGKTGINCFLMITGYFMCKSQITLRKFLKLILEVYFYRIVIFGIFTVTGYESITPMRLLKLLMPVWGLETNFVSCFIVFWLTIPFLNILVQNMTQRQHQYVLFLLLGMYTILGTIPGFKISMNYVTWFGIVYLIAAYIRIYPHPIFNHTALWGWLSLVTFVVATLGIVVLQYKANAGSFLVSDSNKFFAVAIAVTSFLWFKNLNIGYSKLINMVGGSIFAVLLIHANSSAMLQWLWRDLLNVPEHYTLPLSQLVLFSIAVVLSVFVSCILIDWIRIYLFENPFFKYYDKIKKLSVL